MYWILEGDGGRHLSRSWAKSSMNRLLAKRGELMRQGGRRQGIYLASITARYLASFAVSFHHPQHVPPNLEQKWPCGFRRFAHYAFLPRRLLSFSDPRPLSLDRREQERLEPGRSFRLQGWHAMMNDRRHRHSTATWLEGAVPGPWVEAGPCEGGCRKRFAENYFPFSGRVYHCLFRARHWNAISASKHQRDRRPRVVAAPRLYMVLGRCQVNGSRQRRTAAAPPRLCTP